MKLTMNDRLSVLASLKDVTAYYGIVAYSVVFVFLLFCAGVTSARAEIIIESGTPYRIVCDWVGQSGIVPGALHSLKTPLVHMQSGEWDDSYWVFNRVDNKGYTIRNHHTGQYITFDSIRTSHKAFVDLTDRVCGDSSLWRMVERGSSFIIQSVVDTLHSFYLRSGSYIEGTIYNMSAFGTRSLYHLVDRQGRQLLPESERRKNVLNYLYSLRLDGVRPLFLTKYESLVLSVKPEKLDESRVRLSVDYDSENGSVFLYINGRKVNAGEVFNFGSPDALQSVRLSVRKNGGIVSETMMRISFMPVVEITGSGFSNSEFANGMFRIIDPSFPEHNDSIYHAQYRHRGISSAGKQKKSYAVKLTDTSYKESLNRSIHGLRNDNYWVMDAMAIDVARMRNPLSLGLWNDFATEVYYRSSEPSVVRGPRCFFVEAYLNGKYVGIYNMMERNDRKLYQLKKSKVIDGVETIRGILFKGDYWGPGVQMHYTSAVPDYSNQSAAWDGWAMQYPKLEDAQKIDWGPTYRAVNFVSHASASDFRKKVSDYFDIPRLVDYYLLVELTQGYDNMGKNIYYLIYNAQESEKLTVAPWDFDATWGRDWDGAIHERESATYDTDNLMCVLNGLYEKMKLYYPGWRQMLGKRYAELRPWVFNEDSLRLRLDRNFRLFHCSGADTREVEAWNGADGIWLDFPAEQEYMHKWLSGRIAYLDKKYGFDATDVMQLLSDAPLELFPGKGTLRLSSPTDVTVAVVDMMGHVVRQLTLVASEMVTIELPAGIYLVGRKKVAIK